MNGPRSCPSRSRRQWSSAMRIAISTGSRAWSHLRSVTTPILPVITNLQIWRNNTVVSVRKTGESLATSAFIWYSVHEGQCAQTGAADTLAFGMIDQEQSGQIIGWGIESGRSPVSADRAMRTSRHHDTGSVVTNCANEPNFTAGTRHNRRHDRGRSVNASRRESFETNPNPGRRSKSAERTQFESPSSTRYRSSAIWPEMVDLPRFVRCTMCLYSRAWRQ